MSCILCKRTGGIFNICTIYGNAKHTVRADIIEIFGDDAEPYLCPTDCVCNVCMYMLESVVKLKWRLWQVISIENRDCKPIKLGKIWELFATFKREEDDREDNDVLCRTPTPSNLLALSYSRDYNYRLEEEIATRERNRSLTGRTSSGFGRSEVFEIESELRNINAKKKGRKRGRPKNHARSAPLQTIHREQWDRSCSPLSNCCTPTKRKEVLYDEQGRLTRKRTRSVSREQEKEVKRMEQLETMKFYCLERDCPLYFEDLDVLTQHKILDHNILALHYCDECHKRYTTAKHLKLHGTVHDVCPFWCPLCLTELTNQKALQEHLDEHTLYSVPCKYCDKSFLNKNLCESHMKASHAGRRERIVYKERIIIDRIDKNGLNKSNKKHNNLKSSNNSRQFRVFMSPFTEVEWSNTELDVTSKNLRLMNIDFTTHTESIKTNNTTDTSELIESEAAKMPVTTS